jgi:hypothetical protein
VSDKVTDMARQGKDEHVQAIWNEQLQCEVDGVEYDFRKRAGIVRMPWGNCTDMDGCIRLFEAIDEDVRTIQTIEAGGLDTRYVRILKNKWHAQSPDSIKGGRDV